VVPAFGRRCIAPRIVAPPSNIVEYSRPPHDAHHASWGPRLSSRLFFGAPNVRTVHVGVKVRAHRRPRCCGTISPRAATRPSAAGLRRRALALPGVGGLVEAEGHPRPANQDWPPDEIGLRHHQVDRLLLGCRQRPCLEHRTAGAHEAEEIIAVDVLLEERAGRRRLVDVPFLDVGAELSQKTSGVLARRSSRLGVEDAAHLESSLRSTIIDCGGSGQPRPAAKAC
jgi:hypothetical protein